MNRTTLQGTRNILRFNWKFYLMGFILLALLIACIELISFPIWLSTLALLIVGYGLITPLVVSAIVYDFSNFYSLHWLRDLKLPHSLETTNVNIHSGFDETSNAISQLFPSSKLEVMDFYNPTLHTEPAIVIARKHSEVHPHTISIPTHDIPLNDDSVDHIFLIFSIHEIRDENERIQFLKECRRICKIHGKIIIVEHLRDIPNFLAFSIGFNHFYSKRKWMSNFKAAGFTSISKNKFTPFVTIFILNND